MIDIGPKRPVARRAMAQGSIQLRKVTIAAVREKRIAKGDPIETARIAATMAVKRTAELIPYCHPIPLEAANIDFDVGDKGIEVRCEVRARYKTGAEMEALVGVTTALLVIWDMVKYLEKDAGGQYPTTAIGDVRVVAKEKGTVGGERRDGI